jgi:dynein heavy chain
LINKVTRPLDVLERMKVINIITIDVHSRDVVQNFVNMRINEAESFSWQSQLKFEWTLDKNSDVSSRQFCRFPWETNKGKFKCVIKIVDWFRFYSYEYVGNTLRLVITPLTDRCYITLTQALNLVMGGAPAGPAGTGKTETTKDLGRAVGLPVMVFNCSDQMGKDSMAQIFMGLCQSGAWGCFDEFNRISLEVLSVISTQVKTCLDAQKEKKRKFVFMEEGEIGL